MQVHVRVRVFFVALLSYFMRANPLDFVCVALVCVWRGVLVATCLWFVYCSLSTVESSRSDHRLQAHQMLAYIMQRSANSNNNKADGQKGFKR